MSEEKQNKICPISLMREDKDEMYCGPRCALYMDNYTSCAVKVSAEVLLNISHSFDKAPMLRLAPQNPFPPIIKPH